MFLNECNYVILMRGLIRTYVVIMSVAGFDYGCSVNMIHQPLKGILHAIYILIQSEIYNHILNIIIIHYIYLKTL